MAGCKLYLNGQGKLHVASMGCPSWRARLALSAPELLKGIGHRVAGLQVLLAAHTPGQQQTDAC